MFASNSSFDVVFKTVAEVPFKATIFPAPAHSTQQFPHGAPIALYYHSGGLTGGSRLGYFPNWLATYCNKRGIHLATLDYRLIPTGNIQDLEDDAYDGYKYCIGSQLSSQLEDQGFAPVDPQRVAITSASAGCLLASLLTLRILEEADIPPPKVFLGLYGMTNIASSFYNVQKEPEKLVGKGTTRRPLGEVQHLFDKARLPCLETDVKWFRSTIENAKSEEDKVAYDQTNLTNTMFNEGLGAEILFNAPGLSRLLGDLAPTLDEDVSKQEKSIPMEWSRWFPITRLPSTFPATLLFHGEEDVAIPYQDSQVFLNKLQKEGVKSRFILVKGEGTGHGFDRADIDKYWGTYMSNNLDWLFGQI